VDDGDDDYGDDQDEIQDIAIDSSGNLLVTGFSGSAWPETAVAGQEFTAKTDQAAGVRNGFVAKLSPDGALLWHAFLKGGGQKLLYAIDLDTAGNIYASGVATDDWPGAVRAWSGGSEDGLVVKLTSSGSLVWHTFLGGTSADRAEGIAVEPGGISYVSGYTYTTEWGAPLRGFEGSIDGYAAKIGTDGSLVWHTFLGGADTDIILDGSGGVYLAGYSQSGLTGTLPAGSPLRAYTAGYDAFAAKLLATGSLDWYTYLGGSGSDQAYNITHNGSSLYVAGTSNATWGAPDRAYSGDTDAFVSQLGMDGALSWNTFLGGTASDTSFGAGADKGYGVTIGADGIPYVTGSSKKSAWAETPLRAYTDSTDIFVARLGDSASSSQILSETGTQSETGSETDGILINYPGGIFDISGARVIVPVGAVPDGSHLYADFTAYPPQVNGVWALGGVVDIRIFGPDGQEIHYFDPPLEICIPYISADVQTAGGIDQLRVGWTDAIGEPWNLLTTYVKVDKMLACGQINHLTVFGLFETQQSLPDTGFAPGVVTQVEEPTVDYFELGANQNPSFDSSPWKGEDARRAGEGDGMTLEIPSLGISMPVVGVPETFDGWDVSWLGANAGWLEGTAYPTWAGNSALTGHVYDADGLPGPFSMLHTLWWGDEVLVHAWGQTYTYEVRSAVITTPDKALPHEELDWLTLVTCRGYDAIEESYPWRTVVRAVLVDVK
jgi:LPXTG-site transpeptidase (sortase) family protein